MRAVIIGTDFMKDTDGSFKTLETNTNIGLEFVSGDFIDSSSIISLIENNNINEVHFIYNPKNITISTNVFVPDSTLIITGQNFLSFLSSSINTYSLQNEEFNCIFEEHQTDDSAITIPFIEDADNKLIIRVAYDTTAVIDDTYAKDNWEFLKLMYDVDPNSIPKCYINDDELGIDNIGTELRDNGNHPNYCIKKRITPADNKVYPILYKINTLDQLEEIKSNLEVDEYIQEYIFNSDDVLDNRISFYRSVDMIYGSNLDALNLTIYQKSTLLEYTTNCDYTDNNVVESWDRPKYLPKYTNSNSDISVRIDADENTKILLSDNTIKVAKDLQIGDIVSSINFTELNVSESNYGNWSSNFNDFVNSANPATASVLEKDSFEYFGKIINVELENGALFSDVPHATIFKINYQYETSSVNIEDKHEFNITIGDNSFYFEEIENNPILALYKGETYTFNVNTLTKPFYIKTSSDISDETLYNEGVINNGLEQGVITFTIPLDAPDLLYYSDNNEIIGTIQIKNPKTIIENKFIKFIDYQSLQINDYVLLLDRNSNELIEEKITNIYYTIDKLTAYRINVESPNLFLTLNESDNNRYGIITHNYDYDCYQYFCGTGAIEGYDCGGGWYFDCSSNTDSACIRVGSWYGATDRQCYEDYYTWQGNNYSCGLVGYPNMLGYCNGQKSDKRLKKNIKFLYEQDNGIKVYEFEFIDVVIENNPDLAGVWQGVIAQELINTPFEEALTLEDDGYFIVDYSKISVENKKIN